MELLLLCFILGSDGWNILYRYCISRVPAKQAIWRATSRPIDFLLPNFSSLGIQACKIIESNEFYRQVLSKAQYNHTKGNFKKSFIFESARLVGCIDTSLPTVVRGIFLSLH